MIPNKNKLKQTRMKQYLIQSAKSAIEEDGYKNITVRKISAASGYNSATIYNYFDNLDELISLTLIDLVVDYFKSMTSLLRVEESSYLTFLLIWRTYANFSFNDPDIYTHVFYSEKTHEILEKLPEYTAIFSDTPSMADNDKLVERSLGITIKERDDLAIDPCIQDGYFDSNDKAYITNFSYALALGMCRQIKVEHSNPAQMTARFVDYQVDFILRHSRINVDKDTLVQTILNYEF